MQGQLSSCATRCGDGRRVLMFEECDDANTDSGDGCRGRETANTARRLIRYIQICRGKPEKTWRILFSSDFWSCIGTLVICCRTNYCCCSPIFIPGAAPLAQWKLAMFAKMGRRWSGTTAIPNVAGCIF